MVEHSTAQHSSWYTESCSRCIASYSHYMESLRWYIESCSKCIRSCNQYMESSRQYIESSVEAILRELVKRVRQHIEGTEHFSIV